VNRAAWLAKCDAFVTMDGRFEAAFQEEIADFRGLCISSARPVTVVRNMLRCNPGPHTGMSWAFPVLHGNNSGHAALNATLLLGFKRIYLLGFDFGIADRTHWHAGYRWREADMEARHTAWAEAIDACADDISAHDVNIVNVIGAYPSRLTAYPTMSLHDFCNTAP
jgi:hypothetical protein